MSGRGRGRKRKQPARQAATTAAKRRAEEPEILDVLASGGADFSDHEAQQKGRVETVSQRKFVDFEAVLSHEMPDMLDRTPEPAPFEQIPEMVRCGEDDLAFHVPESVVLRIKRHQFIDLSVLLKGSVELCEMYSGATSSNGQGQTESRKKYNSEIKNIDLWTDAFLIYTSIYLDEHPKAKSELLHYTSIIRSAARKFTGYGWRYYDEQFRLRQAKKLAPWNVIHNNLYLQSFSGQPLRNQTSSNTSATITSSSSKCIDFNTGNCQWSNCRYLHACFVCSSPTHGKRTCSKFQANTADHEYPNTSNVSNSYNPTSQIPFRGRPSSYRGYSRGYRGRKQW